MYIDGMITRIWIEADTTQTVNARLFEGDFVTVDGQQVYRRQSIIGEHSQHLPGDADLGTWLAALVAENADGRDIR